MLQFRLFTVVSEPSGELRSEPSTSASVQTTGQKAVASAVCQTGRHVRWPRSPSIAISMSSGLSVYPLAYLKDRVSKFCQIFCACCLWPWLNCSLRTTRLCYVLPFIFRSRHVCTQWPGTSGENSARVTHRGIASSLLSSIASLPATIN